MDMKTEVVIIAVVLVLLSGMAFLVAMTATWQGGGEEPAGEKEPSPEEIPMPSLPEGHEERGQQPPELPF